MGQAFTGSFFYDPGQSPTTSGGTLGEYNFPAGQAGLSTLFAPPGNTSLPSPSRVVAQQLEALAGTVTVDFDTPSALGFSGTVTNAFAIPEPSTAALLLAGVAALGRGRGQPARGA